MPKRSVEVPFNTPPYQNVDGMVLDNFSETLFDGYIDELGNTNKRDGLKYHTDLESFKKSEGAHWLENKNIALFNSDGNIYKISDTLGTVTNITNSGDSILSNGHAVFTDNGAYFVACNGGKMVYSDGTNNTDYITDSDAPQEVSHVAFLDYYLIANKIGTGQFYFADFLSTPTTWSALDFQTAESLPDNIISLYVVNRTIVVFGTSTIEYFQNDGISPFSRLNGTEINRGAMAKHSTVNVNGVLYFFDDKRRLCLLDGFTLRQINTSFDRVIQKFSTVSDCVASYEHFNGNDLIRFNFSTEKRTLVYHIQNNYWVEDSYYDSASNERQHYLGSCYLHAKGWNQHLVGSRFDGNIFLRDTETFKDDSQQIRFKKVTGWIDHNIPDKKKISYSLTFRFKSGVGIGANKDIEPLATIRWRNDGNSQWSNYMHIKLKIKGQTEFVYRMFNLGCYFSRQYELTFSQDAPFILGKVTEEVQFD